MAHITYDHFTLDTVFYIARSLAPACSLFMLDTAAMSIFFIKALFLFVIGYFRDNTLSTYRFKTSHENYRGQPVK